VATSFFDSAIYEFNASNGALLKTLVAPYSNQSVLAGPSGLTTGPDGNLYISSQFTNSIVEYNVTTNTLSTFIPSSVLGPIASANGDAQFAPAGLRFGPDGNLYVSLNGGHSATSGGAVVRFSITNTGGLLSYAGSNTTIATGLIQPTEMAFGVAPTQLDTLYVSDSGAGSVVKITQADGTSPTTSTFIPAGSHGLNYPSGLTWGVDGRLYVVDLGATSLQGQGQVLRYNADGSFDKVFTQPSGSLQFQFPSDVVFNSAGQLLTADLGPAYPPNLQGSIDLFNSNGTFAKTLVSSSLFPNTTPGTSGFSPSQLTLNIGIVAPTANAGGPYSINEGDALKLDASGSTDPQGIPLTYSWDVNGDGKFGDVTGVTPSLSWAKLNSLGITGPGTWSIRVEASDGHGHVVTSTATSLTIHVPVVATSYFDSAVYEFDANTGALLKTLVAPYSQSILSGPSGATIGPDGNLYFSSQLNNSIVEYNLKTNTLSTLISSSVLDPIATANGDSTFAPSGLAFGPGGGNLFVSLNGGFGATSGGAVVRFSITTKNGALAYGGTATTIATGLVEPTEMTFGVLPNDRTSLYVSNSEAGSVVRIANATGTNPTPSTFIAAGSGGLSFPTGLTWGLDGKLYVVDLGATTLLGQVLRYNANGTFDEAFTQPANALQFQFPSDALFTPNGELLTADLGPFHPPNLAGSIAEFDPNGTFNQFLVNSSLFPNTGTGTSGFSPSQITLIAPSVSISGPSAGSVGQPYTLNLMGVSVPGDSISRWTIHWGDGTTTVVNGNPTSVKHVYTGSNHYTITATASDNVGTFSAADSVDVTV
jgi:hypothetical protein